MWPHAKRLILYLLYQTAKHGKDYLRALGKMAGHDSFPTTPIKSYLRRINKDYRFHHLYAAQISLSARPHALAAAVATAYRIASENPDVLEKIPRTRVFRAGKIPKDVHAVVERYQQFFWEVYERSKESGPMEALRRVGIVEGTYSTGKGLWEEVVRPVIAYVLRKVKKHGKEFLWHVASTVREDGFPGMNALTKALKHINPDYGKFWPPALQTVDPYFRPHIIATALAVAKHIIEEEPEILKFIQDLEEGGKLLVPPGVLAAIDKRRDLAREYYKMSLEEGLSGPKKVLKKAGLIREGREPL